MTRWPPILWLLISVGSLFLLVGYNGEDFNPAALVAGAVLIAVAVAGAFWLAFGRWGDRPQVAGVSWLIPATMVFYVLCAAAGSIEGGKYAGAALAAGLIPLTAVTLLTATARAKTTGGDDARVETTRAAARDPFPGIGADDETALGDTTEHSDAERVARPDDRFERRGNTRAR
jgi:hypothetical protein